MIEYILLFCFIYILLFYFNYFLDPIPGPMPIPFIGNVLYCIESDKHPDKTKQALETYNKFGPIWKIYLPSKSFIRLERCIYICQPQDLEIVLKTSFSHFEKGKIQYDIFKDLLGDGIFNKDGDIWKSHRKIASYKFSQANLNNFMLKIFKKHTINILQNDIPTDIFDAQKLMFEFTLNTILEIGVGIDPHTYTLGNDFGKHFDYIQQRCHKRFFSPLWKIMNRFNIGDEYKANKAIEYINSAILTIIDERRYSPAYSDILSQFMLYRKRGYSCKNVNYLRDVVINFLVAGRDTTATALTWSIYELGKNDDIYNKVRTEILNNSVESITHMPYLHAFVNEVLRLHPPISIDTKVCVKNTKLSNGYEVYKGDRIFYVPLLTGLLPSLWDDAESFMPERWFNKKPTQFEFPVFNAGYRLCLGKSMAYLEIKIFLFYLVKHYSIELVKQNIKHVSKITLNIENGLFVKFKKI